MAHQLTIQLNGKVEMAYQGATPWHGLGNSLHIGQTRDERRQAAGMDWTIEKTDVQYQIGSTRTFPEKNVLFRSDTHSPLAIVSDRYQIVQPATVLDFFEDLIKEDGFSLETAGTLDGGKRFWGLARTGFDGDIVQNDRMKTFLLLATSCDGSLATVAKFTSVRVVCNNTLQMAFSHKAEQGQIVKVRHNTTFNPVAVKGQLGLNAKEVFDSFMDRMRTLAEKPVSVSKAQDIVDHLFARAGTAMRPGCETRGFRIVMDLFQGRGKGASLRGVSGTGWGLVNAVTEYTDFHARARSSDNRLNSAWFGSGADLKERIVSLVDSL